MNASRWIVGCAFAAVFWTPAFASASPADFGNGDGGGRQSAGNGSSTHSLVNTASAGGGGDTTTLPPSRSRGNEAPASSSSDADSDPSSNLPVSGSARQATPRRASPGWQSLLPGSIQ
ncbi:MAG: hypothetical protein KGN77_08685 [Xanthomonadaceae bacterium]|nr:hypothetical protein [Xanthomonadaceae bacterium]MDE1965612.1 hypothetical protein [Xanthomonadaceae bacterium]